MFCSRKTRVQLRLRVRWRLYGLAFLTSVVSFSMSGSFCWSDRPAPWPGPESVSTKSSEALFFFYSDDSSVYIHVILECQDAYCRASSGHDAHYWRLLFASTAALSTCLSSRSSRVWFVLPVLLAIPPRTYRVCHLCLATHLHRLASVVSLSLSSSFYRSGPTSPWPGPAIISTKKLRSAVIFFFILMLTLSIFLLF